MHHHSPSIHLGNYSCSAWPAASGVAITGERSNKAAVGWSVVSSLCVLHSGGLPCSLGRPWLWKVRQRRRRLRWKKKGKRLLSMPKWWGERQAGPEHWMSHLLHELFFCNYSVFLQTLFLFLERTLKKFCSFKLGKVPTFDWGGFVFVENNNFALRLGNTSSSSSKSLYFKFCSPGCKNINTCNTLWSQLHCAWENFLLLHIIQHVFI